MSPHSSHTILVGALLVALGACASRPLAPQTASSAGGIGYALSYPDATRAAAESFASHRKQARDLSGSFVARAPQPRSQEDRTQLLYVVDQADADGRREGSVEARRSERAVRAFWESERGAIGARVTSVTQKQLTDNGCTQVDSQPAVHQALRESVSRQLEKRLRRESEAQRYLEEIKGRLPAPTWSAAQRSAEDVAEASYLVYVALVDDVLELQRLQREHEQVVATLQSALERERSVQSGGAAARDVDASRERARLYENKLSAVQASQASLDRTLADAEPQLQEARDEYEQALAALRAKLPPAAQPAPAAATK